MKSNFMYYNCYQALDECIELTEMIFQQLNHILNIIQHKIKTMFLNLNQKQNSKILTTCPSATVTAFAQALFPLCCGLIGMMIPCIKS